MIKIIIVDDDESIRYLYKTYLELMGYQILGIAKNGLHAINIIKESSNLPDIVLMDYRMPIINGIESIKKIMKLNSNIKFILFSADARISLKAMHLGISFIEKPINLEKLNILIQELVKKPCSNISI